MDIQTIQTVMHAISLHLKEYELTKKCTAVILYQESEDIKIFKTFFVSKKIEGLSPKSLSHYNHVLTKFFEFTSKPIKEIDTESIRAYLAHKSLKDKISNVSLTNIRRVINSFFTWMVREEYILRNPLLKIPTIKIAKRLKHPFTEEELERLRHGAKTLRDRAVVELLFSTGMRCGELCSLNISDVNFNTETIRVIGKGNKEREVYLNAKSKLVLSLYLNSRTDKCSALICGLRASLKKRLNIAGVEIMLRNLGKSLGIENVHPHRFRRTMATFALNRNVPINVVSLCLGHDSINTTTIYAITDKEQVKMAHRKAIC